MNRALPQILAGPGQVTAAGYFGPERVTHLASVRSYEGNFYYAKEVWTEDGRLRLVDLKKLGGWREEAEGGVGPGAASLTREGIAQEPQSRLWEMAQQIPGWWAYLRRILGYPPPGMVGAHAHHILMKMGRGPIQQALVQEGQALLRRYGIDPIFGPEILTWAPKDAAAQHSTETLRQVVEALKGVEGRGGPREFIRKNIVQTLKKLGAQAASRQ